MTYSYNTDLLMAGGKDQLRMDLGDNAVEGGAETCVLCDEEYEALLLGFGAEVVVWEELGSEGVSLGVYSSSKKRCFPVYRVDKELWIRVKLHCVELVLARFSHQVNTTIDSLSYGFGARASHWLSMKQDLEKELERCTGSGAISSGSRGAGSFGVGIHDNVRG